MLMHISELVLRRVNCLIRVWVPAGMGVEYLNRSLRELPRAVVVLPPASFGSFTCTSGVSSETRRSREQIDLH